MKYLLFLIILVWGLRAGATGTYYMSKDAALKIYFPDQTINRKTEYLDAEQKKAIKQKARAPWDHSVVTYYEAVHNGKVTGYAFFESEIVRTKIATYMVVINADGSVRGVEILAFYEPEDYKPPRRWLEQFHRRTLADDLTLKSGVKNIVGSTLSAQALSDGVRRYLAFFEIIISK